MNINNHNITVSKTAHFSTIGELSKSTKYIWIVAHGYGQRANRIIGKFDFLDPSEHFVIAPEGLSRFYWHKNNEPVSSWMTKDNRYHEIRDFVNYLDSIYDLFCKHVDYSVRVVLFGFSQGCATIWRWIHASQPRFHAMINWAGWIPEDISYVHMGEYLQDKSIYSFYGDEDEFLSEEVIDKMMGVIRMNRLNIVAESFSGTHRIPTEVLKEKTRKFILRNSE